MKLAEVIMVVFLTLLSWQSGAGLAMASEEVGPTYVFNSSESSVTMVGEWVSSPILVSDFPEERFTGWTVLTAVLDLTHPTPANLRVLLTNPENVSVIVGDESYGSITPCPNFYVVTVADNQPYQTRVSAGASNIPCPPRTIAPVGDRYYLLSLPSVSAYQIVMSPSPIRDILQNKTINGEWKLVIFDGSPTNNNDRNGTLASWSIRIDCEILLFVSPRTILTTLTALTTPTI